ncbi:uncharacterized protein FFNC_12104 [Fusarium fujikuroi]|nr:uncharacterized protein FFC1_07133 [Fusarium fujikuroi]SCO48374.1 uncharacterized protein FFNC_12104 [Fusarium fujikuroi]
MRAKQLKEEARSRRNQGTNFASAKQNKRKVKQETLMSPAIKLEGDGILDDFPIFPGFFDHEQDQDVQEELSLGADSMSLKGQVWPGMGKMDLADDEMRRTRNQKKPKSVIDRMKRASERIEPTQVILTSELEVERTKDVYDDASSPAPGQEESTPPRKAPKTKRKKVTPLAEISANAPKQRRSTARGPKTGTGKKTNPTKKQNREKEPKTYPPPDKPQVIHDVFRDEKDRPASISEPPLPVTRNDRRFDLRTKHGARSIDNFLHSNLVSPTPHPRDLAPRQLLGRETSNTLRPESFPPGTFSHVEASYALKDATIYNASSRLPFVPPNFDQYRGLGPDQFRLAADYGFQLKHEDYTGSITGDVTQGTNSSPFMGVPGTNPLFSHDRPFLNPYSQATPNATFSPLPFTSINRQQDQLHNDGGMKTPQAQICEPNENNGGLGEEQELSMHAPWNLNGTENDLDFSHSLAVDDSQM